MSEGKKCKGEREKKYDSSDRTLKNSQLTITRHSLTVAFFVKQVEIGIMLMEFRKDLS